MADFVLSVLGQYIPWLVQFAMTAFIVYMQKKHMAISRDALLGIINAADKAAVTAVSGAPVDTNSGK